MSAAGLVLALAVLAAPLPVPRPPEIPTAEIPAAEVPAAEVPAAAAAGPEVAPAPMPGPGEMVCRDPRLLGDPRPGRVELRGIACGVLSPVRVRAVAGMRLEPPVLIGCPTARSLADWLDGVVRVEAPDRLQGRVARVHTLGSYVCRRQNHAAGGPRSEHARGRAVDIAGFTLTDGREISLARGWGEGAAGGFLRAIWRKACGPFSTVLGPAADRHHRDHFHLDTAPGRSEPYCQ